MSDTLLDRFIEKKDKERAKRSPIHHYSPGVGQDRVPYQELRYGTAKKKEIPYFDVQKYPDRKPNFNHPEFWRKREADGFDTTLLKPALKEFRTRIAHLYRSPEQKKKLGKALEVINSTDLAKRSDCYKREVSHYHGGITAFVDSKFWDELKDEKVTNYGLANAWVMPTVEADILMEVAKEVPELYSFFIGKSKQAFARGVTRLDFRFPKNADLQHAGLDAKGAKGANEYFMGTGKTAGGLREMISAPINLKENLITEKIVI